MFKGLVIRYYAGGTCCMSAVTRITARMQVLSPSMVIMIRLIGIVISVRSSLCCSAMTNPCFSNEANMTTQYSLVG